MFIFIFQYIQLTIFIVHMSTKYAKWSFSMDDKFKTGNMVNQTGICAKQ